VSESRSGEHQELEGRFQAVVSERYGASGAPTAELSVSNVRQAADRANYVVGISNGTDSTFTVLVVFATSDSADPQEIADEILPGEATAFVLTPRGQCASLLCYVMGFSSMINWHFARLRRGFGRRKGSARKLATQIHAPIFGN
jgi:hypothetical protein